VGRRQRQSGRRRGSGVDRFAVVLELSAGGVLRPIRGFRRPESCSFPVSCESLEIAFSLYCHPSFRGRGASPMAWIGRMWPSGAVRLPVKSREDPDIDDGRVAITTSLESGFGVHGLDDGRGWTLRS